MCGWPLFSRGYLRKQCVIVNSYPVRLLGITPIAATSAVLVLRDQQPQCFPRIQHLVYYLRRFFAAQFQAGQ